MRAFLIEHNGVYLGGFSIMVSENEPSKRQIEAFLKKQPSLASLPERKIHKVQEIDLTQANNLVIWDGNY